MAISYKIVTIEDYDDDAETENALNAEGEDRWIMSISTLQPNESTGKSTGTLIFKRSSSSSSISASSSSISASSSSTSSSSSTTPLDSLWSIRMDVDAGNISWDGDGYLFTGESGSLDVICCWAEGFRPDAIRIYYTGDTVIGLTVYDTEGVSLNHLTGYTSGFPLSLIFAGNDIGYMKLSSVATGLHLTEVTFDIS